MTSITNIAQAFAEFDEKVGTRKTGYFGYGVDMYTKRGGSDQRVFRVKWFERNAKYPTHKAFKKAQRASTRCIQEWVEKNETFPYTPEGLEAAMAFYKTIEHHLEAFGNRED